MTEESIDRTDRSRNTKRKHEPEPMLEVDENFMVQPVTDNGDVELSTHLSTQESFGEITERESE